MNVVPWRTASPMEALPKSKAHTTGSMFMVLRGILPGRGWEASLFDGPRNLESGQRGKTLTLPSPIRWARVLPADWESGQREWE